MYGKRIRIGVFVFMGIVALPAFAQTNIKLEDCINEAFENNLQIKNAQYQSSAASLSVKKSKMNMLPSVNGFYDHTIMSSSSDYSSLNDSFEDSETTGGTVGVEASLPLFKGLENYYALKQSKIYDNASKYRVEQLKSDISLQIADVFIKAVYYRDLVSLSGEQIALTQLQIEKMKKYIAAGTQTKHELLKLQYQLSQEEVTKKDAENRYHQTCVVLANIMNWNLSKADSMNLITPNIDDISEDQMPALAGIYANALTIYPQIKSDSLNVEALSYNEKMAVSRALPKVSLNYRYSKWYSSGDDMYPEYLSAGDIFENTSRNALVLNVSIPIFNKGDVMYSKKTAEISLKQAQLDAEDNKSALYEDIIIAYDSYELAKTKMQMQHKALVTAKESFEISEKKLNAGVNTILDYTIEKNNLLVAETNLLNAQYEYVFALKVLDFYQGKPIKL